VTKPPVPIDVNVDQSDGNNKHSSLTNAAVP
jgi:hypothetical protein